MSSKAPRYPEPTSEERNLQADQAEALRWQTRMLQSGAAETRALAPYLYRQMGLNPQFDEEGVITGFEEDPSFTKQQELIRQRQLEELEYGGERLASERARLGLEPERLALDRERLAAEREFLPIQQDTTRSQLELAGEQAEYNRRLQRQQELLQPEQFEMMGVKPIRNEAGEITGFESLDDPGRARRDEIQRLQEERSLAALKGELPTDPALLRDLNERETLTRERLRRQLGTGFEATTAGSESLGEFEESRAMTLDAARRADLTLAEQLGLNRGQSNRQEDAQRMAMLQSVGPKSFTQASTLGGALGGTGLFGGGGNLFGSGGGGGGGGFNLGGLQGLLMNPANQSGSMANQFSNLTGGYESVMGNLANWRGNQFQANVSKAQQQQAENQLYGQIGGSVLAAGATAAIIAGAGAVGASSRTLKRDIAALGPAEEASTLAELMGEM